MSRRVAAEFIGTALLLVAVTGSGIMGERLAGGNRAIVLLANSIATAAALVALILAFRPVSGAHFNPVVTLALGTPRREALCFVVAQVAGAFVGVAAADLIFGLPVYSISRHERSGLAQMGSEAIATFGMIAVLFAVSRRRPTAVAYAVAAYIGGAYWFTSSTSFANPAVTLARAFTDTFVGIRPIDVPGFVVAQGVGAALAALLARWLVPVDAAQAA